MSNVPILFRQSVSTQIAVGSQGVKMNYARAIRIVRAARGVQSGALAEAASVSPSYLSLLERGKRSPSTKIIERIARALRFPVPLFVLLASSQGDLEAIRDRDLDGFTRGLVGALVSDGENRDCDGD